MLAVSELEQPYQNVTSRTVVARADDLIRGLNQAPSLYETRLLQRDLAPAVKDIKDLLAYDAERDGRGTLAPDDSTVVHGIAWLREFYREAMGHSHPWIRPHVTISANGEVVFEWWRATKKLTVYVSSETSEYVRVWGEDIQSEMADGDASSSSSRRRLWEWLTA